MQKYTIKVCGEEIPYNNKLSDELIKKLQINYPFLNTKDKILPGEEWKKYPYTFWKDLIPQSRASQYSYIKEIGVSSKGRVRITDNRTEETFIAEQENDINYPDGYLRVKGYASLGHVYRMVARTFILGDEEEPKDENKKLYPIHHIDNNGYNNSWENLMYVSPEEHSKIHFGKTNNL